ncbi:HTH-type transcriptional repressor ComR [Pseudodesulfovibrio hydrargyri]|uniref:HTH-type transcriptional repressor ComR n=1 Tax=Pseudodesulfovibrio hydrargyri TaxID=2125990 RepID=A0A1J5MZX8_9BACT|nr:TetR/AcrR family transcriptional regulator [Pseudodesulfovibrio hydrargyri]OIQ48939.1 HTH-type transcriptional repressor ComR [Pseudodesulfovibrio hydrargyri]
MARNKEYEKDQVLNAATRVFWEKGYTGTSVNALVQATGLGKRSMYKEFGSKENLFRECLQNYMFNLNREASSILSRQPLGLANIEAFFANRIDQASICDSDGCMVINSAVEKKLIDAGTFDLVQESLAGLEDAFFACLEAAADRGEIPEGKDLEVLAGFLMTFTAGMMALCKTKPGKMALTARVDTALSIVKNK